MAAPVLSPLSLVPRDAAPELTDYPQFKPCDSPEESGAIRAYKGYIRPFSDDQTARDILRAIESHIPLQISEGRLSLESSHIQKHPFEDFLVGMAVPFVIMVVEFKGTEHPRAFLLRPRMVPRYSLSPHLRTDKSVRIDGRSQPALCVYSGSLFQYRTDRDPLEQFLDQTSTYLAKYLIWLRTRQLFFDSPDGMRHFVYKRKPQETFTEIDLVQSRDLYWDGYWPGPIAPSWPAQHLATIKREDECWCWSGKPYGDCCRAIDVARDKQLRRT
ncbi:MAG: SEC-C domain-containing protein [Terracidiphilus sp.]|jgi:hypothetical protein